MRGREYHGLVYSVTDDKGNKVGNPFKSSLFGKSAGYEAIQKKFVRSKQEIKDRKFADMTKRTVLSVLQGTYDKDRFVSQLKEKGIDTILRYTEEGRIYGWKRYCPFRTFRVLPTCFFTSPADASTRRSGVSRRRFLRSASCSPYFFSSSRVICLLR